MSFAPSDFSIYPNRLPMTLTVAGNAQLRARLTMLSYAFLVFFDARSDGMMDCMCHSVRVMSQASP